MEEKNENTMNLAPGESDATAPLGEAAVAGDPNAGVWDAGVAATEEMPAVEDAPVSGEGTEGAAPAGKKPWSLGAKIAVGVAGGILCLGLTGLSACAGTTLALSNADHGHRIERGIDGGERFGGSAEASPSDRFDRGNGAEQAQPESGDNAESRRLHDERRGGFGDTEGSDSAKGDDTGRPDRRGMERPDRENGEGTDSGSAEGTEDAKRQRPGTGTEQTPGGQDNQQTPSDPNAQQSTLSA